MQPDDALAVELAPATIDAALERLRADGYYILRAAVSKELIAAIDADLAPAFAQTPFGMGSFYGVRTKRFGRLLARSRHAANLALHPSIIAIAEALLLPACDIIQLNVAQAIAIYPGSLQQMPHRDQDMWRLAPSPTEHLLNVIWPFTRFAGKNGATMIFPRSHGERAADVAPPLPPVAAEMAPGDALLFLGSTLHGAGANVTGEVRRGCVIGYSLGWLKPYENQFLSYPPEVARTFSPELAALVGYRQHRPNLGNYEGQCPSVLLHESSPDPLGAIDALRPDQVDAVEAFARTQQGGP